MVHTYKNVCDDIIARGSQQHKSDITPRAL